MSAPAKVRCPTCRAELVWSADNVFRPFCSKRCRLIDLGEWFNELHRIAGESAPREDDADTGY
ncbi:MAG: DNA gyrase inhibitor YacG [Pseudomonadota bacterium]